MNLDLASGYWIFSENNLGSLDSITGNEYTPGSKEIALNGGWNLFSNPYNEEIPWADSNATLSCGTLPMVYHFDGNLYESVTPNTGNNILPWTGYWIKVGGTCALTITK